MTVEVPEPLASRLAAEADARGVSPEAVALDALAGHLGLEKRHLGFAAFGASTTGRRAADAERILAEEGFEPTSDDWVRLLVSPAFEEPLPDDRAGSWCSIDNGQSVLHLDSRFVDFGFISGLWAAINSKFGKLLDTHESDDFDGPELMELYDVLEGWKTDCVASQSPQFVQWEEAIVAGVGVITAAIEVAVRRKWELTIYLESRV